MRLVRSWVQVPVIFSGCDTCSLGWLLGREGKWCSTLPLSLIILFFHCGVKPPFGQGLYLPIKANDLEGSEDFSVQFKFNSGIRFPFDLAKGKKGKQTVEKNICWPKLGEIVALGDQTSARSSFSFDFSCIVWTQQTRKVHIAVVGKKD